MQGETADWLSILRTFLEKFVFRKKKTAASEGRTSDGVHAASQVKSSFFFRLYHFWGRLDATRVGKMLVIDP
jgi:hypothetical protein